MIATLFFLLATMQNCPMHQQHMVEARHDTFGFSHQASAHTFRTLDDGGAIELRANDAKDQATIDAIRKHLQTIAESFQKNDFSKPQFVHGKTPDGVETMKRLRSAIDYRYEELPDGGRVRITTTNAEALDAVHAFIEFQNAEHHGR